MNVKFNSRNLENKSPFGAVKSNENINFSIYVEDGTYVSWIKIIIVNAAMDELREEYFHYSGYFSGFHKYDCNIRMEKPQIYYYSFLFDTERGKYNSGCKDGILHLGEDLPKWQLTVYDSSYKTPDWVSGGIMYQIFPDRFARDESDEMLPAKNYRTVHESWDEIPEFIYDNKDYRANDFFGGNLRGIISRLDYLKSLNVSIIYLNPVFESPENHRYSTADYKNIDPYLGDVETFKELVEKCCEYGIRVVLDGVFSHTGADSIYFNKFGHYESPGAYNSADSPYHDWYKFFSYPDGYESWWGFRNLPNVDEEAPSYMDFIMNDEDGVIKTWQDMGIGGWRLDVCDELPDTFLDKFRAASKKNNPDAFIIGEVWEDATNKESYGIKRKYMLGDQLDSVMNYPFRTAIIGFLKHGDSELFNNRIMSILENYPGPAINMLMNVIGTHDTMRIITKLGISHRVAGEEQGGYTMSHDDYHRGWELLKMAAFLQFCLPGIPSIYYGDEVGLQGFSDPYCRKTYPYDSMDLDILDFYKSLSRFRAANKAVFSGDYTPLICDDGFYSFKRKDLIFMVNNNSYNYAIDEKYKPVFGSTSRGVMPPKTFGVYMAV